MAVASTFEPRKPKRRSAEARKTLSRDDWIAAATVALERKGIANVKIDRLSKQLKVTRGSFYFHFRNLKDLLASLLEEWRLRNCRPFQALGDSQVTDGPAFFDDVTGVWIREDPFSPKLDLAIRDWSRSSTAIAREVRDQDGFRMALLVKAFAAMGYDADEALIRARITYFQQIGYYATYFKEPPAERKRFRPIYSKILIGAVEN
ncbi:TetR family transcriptional regulator [Mesorhizobium sp. L-8-10]|uniref:TetR/AcrR family transcriptional regulator n=1 Tax=unclassified Mesorhizobium TaxID=325217 RepID=UPI001927D4F9|nr:MULTISPECIES: TetR/AcrR family transcriptional regulator [unclassified Mesorhizobium]BCH26688.1 TetR family transcriptional regulator [Mesorhizobium sp. L-8-3]BCH34663.1 TetR family transcriptional regulator [Mesorhizobium sp. L-8-10]